MSGDSVQACDGGERDGSDHGTPDKEGTHPEAPLIRLPLGEEAGHPLQTARMCQGAGGWILSLLGEGGKAGQVWAASCGWRALKTTGDGKVQRRAV